MALKGTAVCTAEEVATVRAVIDTFGVPRAALLLCVSIQALARVAASVGSRAGTIALIRQKLPELTLRLAQTGTPAVPAA